MSKSLKRLTITLLVSLLVSMIASVPVFAEDKMINVSADQGISVTNFVESTKINGDEDLIVVREDSLVFFEGYKDFGYQDITYYPEAKNENGKLVLGKGKEVMFEEKMYVIKPEDDFPRYLGALPEGFTGEYFMASDNYAILRQAGFYEVTYSTAPGAAKESLLIQVTGGVTSDEEPAAEPIVSPEPEVVTAVPTASKVIVNGKEVSFEAYTIDGNNFFKLRDLAQAVKDTEKKFQVGWDAANNAISLESETDYTSVGGELEVSANPSSQNAVPTDSLILLDQGEVGFAAYNINGNNYFKLRSIARAFNIGITWDAKANTVGIDTSIDYVEE